MCTYADMWFCFYRILQIYFQAILKEKETPNETPLGEE